MAFDDSHREPASLDMGRTLSPIGSPTAARLRLMIKDEVNKCLRAERGGEELDLQEVGRAAGAEQVVGLAERRLHEEDSTAASSQTINNDKGLPESLFPIFLFGFIAVIWLITIVDWLEIRMHLAWEYINVNVPFLGMIPMLGSLSITFLFVQ